MYVCMHACMHACMHVCMDRILGSCASGLGVRCSGSGLTIVPQGQDALYQAHMGRIEGVHTYDQRYVRSV